MKIVTHGFKSPEFTSYLRRWLLAVPFLFLLGIIGSIGFHPARADSHPYLNLPERVVQGSEWEAVPAFPSLESFKELVGAVVDPRARRLFAFTRAGEVWLFDNQPEVSTRTRVLDLRNQCRSRGDGGLVNMILHPDFGQTNSPNGRYVYLWYNYHPTPTDTPLGLVEPTWLRLSRFTLMDDLLHFDPASEYILIEQKDEHAWHSGGGMYYNPDDGFLYLAVGDEGGSYGDLNQTQRINVDLYSGILRIDLENRGGDLVKPIDRQALRGSTQGYSIPRDNPWVGQSDVLEEFFAVGLRNPHRMFYDRIRKIGWVFDVGEGSREEINVVKRGANYQWAYMEGTVAARKPKPLDLIGTEEPPVYEYGREGGRAIIGGVIYRGAQFPLMADHMIFGDHDGAIWSASVDATGGLQEVQQMYNFPGTALLSSLNLDNDGEILVAHIAQGIFYRFRNRLNDEVEFPERLSQTGAFSDVLHLVPADGLVAYNVTAPLWSDGANKSRWVSLPGGSMQGNVSAGVIFSGQDAWRFPAGTVFVKHFEILTNTLDSTSIRRLETRFLVQQEDGTVYGVTYRWLPDGSDAVVVPEGATETLEIHTPEGLRSQIWRYPGMQECLQCHTESAGFVLGLNTRQFAGIGSQGTDGRSQLEEWILEGRFANPPNLEVVGGIRPLVNPYLGEGGLSDRARSYLDSNCAHCHRPDGVRASFDFRWTTPLIRQEIIHGTVDDSLGTEGMRAIAPGHPERSAILQRVWSNESNVRMPPLARHKVDEAAATLLQQWIETMSSVEITGLEGGEVIRHSVGQLPIGIEVPGASAAVERIGLYVDGHWYAEMDPQAPRLAVGGLQSGTHVLQWEARLAGGELALSQEFPVVIENDLGLWVATPKPEVVYPANQVPVDIRFNGDPPPAFAGSNEVNEVRVRILRGEEVLAEHAGPPFTFHLNIEPGQHLLRAEVFREGRPEVLASGIFPVYTTGDPLIDITGQDGTRSVNLANINLVEVGIGQASASPRWQGYFGKVPGMVSFQNVPFEGAEGIVIPGADMGGAIGNASGLYFLGADPLEQRVYRIEGWLRSAAGTLPVQFGLTDSTGSVPIVLAPSWQRYPAVIEYTPCNCPADLRVFQVVERTTSNGDWYVASPSVVRLDPVPVQVRSKVGGEYWEETGLEVDGVASGGAAVGIENLTVLPRSFGLMTVTAWGRDGEGRLHQSAPFTILPSLTPEILQLLEEEVLVKGQPEQVYALEVSEDMVNWHEAVRWTQTFPEKWISVEKWVGSEPSSFIRVKAVPGSL